MIVGTFQMDTRKDSVKVDASASRLASPVGGAPVPNVGFLSAVDSSGNQHNLGGSQYMIQPRGIPPVTTDWRTGTDSRNNNVGYEFTGARTSPFKIFIFFLPASVYKWDILYILFFFCRKNRSWRRTPISREWRLWTDSG